MLNKRGAETIASGTLILIGVGVVVAVLLIVSFTVGWRDMFDKAKNYVAGSSGFSNVVSGCEVACGAGNVEAYNNFRREVVIGETKPKITIDVTCKILESAYPFANENKCVMLVKGAIVPQDTINKKDDCKAKWDTTNNKCKVNNIKDDINQIDCEAFWIPAGVGWDKPKINKCAKIS